MRALKKFLLYTLSSFFAGIILFSCYVVIFDSTIKANYYLNKAQKLDNKHPYGSLEAVKYYNKSIKLYEAVENDDGAIQAYINLGLLHYKFGNMLQVERMVLKALNLGKEGLPKELQTKIYLLLASTVPPRKAKLYINKALEISEKLGLRAQSAKAYYLLGKAHEYKAEFEDAEINYMKAVDVVDSFSTMDDFFDAAPLYESLGELYIGEGDLNKAIEYYYKALSHNLREERSVVTANYMKTIGDLYKEKREIPKACEFWAKSEQEYQFFGKPAPISISNLNHSKPCRNIG